MWQHLMWWAMCYMWHVGGGCVWHMPSSKLAAKWHATEPKGARRFHSTELPPKQ
jgi:hypothetical protein